MYKLHTKQQNSRARVQSMPVLKSSDPALGPGLGRDDEAYCYGSDNINIGERRRIMLADHTAISAIRSIK